MPVTQISICNCALIRVGAATISSLTQTDNQGAILCNALYDQTRQDVLRAHPWKFAVMRVQIGPTNTVPAWGYKHEYVLPNDCLRLLPDVRDVNEDDGVGHQIECDANGNSKVIRTDETLLNIRYILDHKNESAWDTGFANAFAWKLAFELSFPLTHEAAVQKNCSEMYKAALMEARSIASMEGSPPQLIADGWTNSRL